MKKKYLAIFMGLAIAASLANVSAADTKKDTKAETTTEAVKDAEETTEAKKDSEKAEETTVLYGTVKEIKDKTITVTPDATLPEQKDAKEQTFSIEDNTPILTFSAKDFKAPEAAKTDDSKAEATSENETEAAKESKKDAENPNKAFFEGMNNLMKDKDVTQIQEALTKDSKAETVVFADMSKDDYTGVILNKDGSVAAVLVITDLQK